MKKGIMDDKDFCLSVIENAFDGIVVLEGSKCIYANKRFFEILGYEEDGNIINKPLKVLVYPEDKNIIKQFLRKKRDARAKPSTDEIRFKHQDGSIVNTEVTTTKIQHEDEILSVLKIRDLSSQNNKDGSIRERLEDLEIKCYRLNEMNNSLNALIKQKENEKKDFEGTVLTNIKELVMPYLTELQKTGLNPRQQVFVDIIQTNLNNIITPFVQRITSKYMNLTPTEIKIATFIKEGKTAKAIAKILNVSESAVNLHRQHVRDKLGLSKKKIGLRTYLLSMT
ncbi:MAG: PAS domain S-box protein [Syntrophorhabdaceae bacterium]|nr:PAS domain S-box protein [Syntrophorhabdaceae bacterium]